MTRALPLFGFLLAAFATSGAVAADPQPLTFDATSVGGPDSGSPLQIWRPAGKGPFPAMLVLHGCGGIYDNTRTWASRLASWGYVAVIVDSFRPRHVKSVCNIGGTAPPKLRAQDAFNAAIYLRTQPDIRPDRIGAIGFSHGGSTALVAAQTSEVPTDRGGHPFAAVVAYYPGCGSTQQRLPMATDVLILIGRDDDWSSAANCQKFVEARDGPPHAPAIKVYPGALHDFDRGGQPSFNNDHYTGGNPEAAADSFVRTKAFLDARLLAN
jgi:dienelactone hydrolase